MDSEVFAQATARDLLADALPQRWAHVQGVAERARTAIGVVESDSRLLIDASLLHDVGYAHPVVRTGFHSLDGARYLRDVGAPARLVNLVAHHSCAALEAALRGLSGELAQYEDEGPAPVRDALWWADMTTTPTGGRTTLGGRVAEIQERYGPDDVVSRFIRLAVPELQAAVDRTEERLRAAGVDYEK